MRCSAAISPRGIPAAAWPKWTRMISPTWSSRPRSAPMSSNIASRRSNGRPGKLVGACLSDQQGDGLWMIYSFYDVGPDARKGLGTFIILDHVIRAARAQSAVRLSRLLGRRFGPHGLQGQLPAAGAPRPRRLAALRDARSPRPRSIASVLADPRARQTHPDRRIASKQKRRSVSAPPSLRPRYY